jgi:hypothetical protein
MELMPGAYGREKTSVWIFSGKVRSTTARQEVDTPADFGLDDFTS